MRYYKYRTFLVLIAFEESSLFFCRIPIEIRFFFYFFIYFLLFRYLIPEGIIDLFIPRNYRTLLVLIAFRVIVFFGRIPCGIRFFDFLITHVFNTWKNNIFIVKLRTFSSKRVWVIVLFLGWIPIGIRFLDFCVVSNNYKL